MLRGSLTYLSEQAALKRAFSGPLARPLVRRFVAGERLSEAIENVQKLNAAGMTATLDYLGESVSTAAEAGFAATQYIAILHAIEGAGAQCNASLKLTQMGLDVDRALCRRNVERIVAQAAQFGNFIRIDMEGSDYTQIAGQEASNHQDADADATAVQYKPSNTNQSIRVLSPGDDGDVSQSNSTTAVAAALNLNKTDQSIDQSQAGAAHGSYLQVAGQGAWSNQDADAGATALQFGASNENKPIRVKSPGGGGSVEQSNDVTALAVALNLNEVCQRLMQEQTGNGSDALQVGGQGSWDDQRGGAWSRAIQGGKKKHSKR